MGHERVGILPRRKPWSEITNNVQASLLNHKIPPAIIGRQTLERVRIKYEKLHTDTGVQAAFSYLVALSTAYAKPEKPGLTAIDINLDCNPSILQITKRLKDYVNENKESPEYAELASRAAADTIVFWSKEQSKQKSLFNDTTTAEEVWDGITGREFCEISRVFFGRLTERYIWYFLDRCLSAQTNSLYHREEFKKLMEEHINDIANHSFETTKITESFAAGWFNKNAVNKRPNDQDVQYFLRIASGKLREELLLEQEK